VPSMTAPWLALRRATVRAPDFGDRGRPAAGRWHLQLAGVREVTPARVPDDPRSARGDRLPPAGVTTCRQIADRSSAKSFDLIPIPHLVALARPGSRASMVQ